MTVLIDDGVWERSQTDCRDTVLSTRHVRVLAVLFE